MRLNILDWVYYVVVNTLGRMTVLKLRLKMLLILKG